MKSIAEEDDLMLVGYHFPYDSRTPLAHMNDPETGMRTGISEPPKGIVKHDLRKGTEACVIPCVEMWEKGKWFDQLTKETQKEMEVWVPKHEQRAAYLTPGEGTPGNFQIRLYLIPYPYNADDVPDHPMEWIESKRKGNASTSYNAAAGTPGPAPDTRHGWQQPYHGYKPAEPKATPAPAKPVVPPPVSKPLPHNLRVRCTGCGHWWKMDDLAKHVENCCPGKEETKVSDWVILCECCDTYDDVAVCLEGFPRKFVAKKEPKPKEVKAEAKEPVEPELTVI